MNFKDNISSKVRKVMSISIFKLYILNNIDYNKTDFWEMRDKFVNDINDITGSISDKVYREYYK